MDPYAVPPIGPAPACALPAPGAADRAAISALRAGTAALTEADRLVAGCNASPADIANAVEHGALAHHRQHEFDVSATWFAKAASIDPSSLGIRFNLMCALARLDRIDAAYVQLDALRAAGHAAERLVANVETDADLAAVRVDPRYYDHRTVDALKAYHDDGTRPEEALFVYGPSDFPDPTGAPIPVTAIVAPDAAPREPFQTSRIPWGQVRTELQIDHTYELSAPVDPEVDPVVAAPLASLVPIERVMFWRPLASADSPVYVVVPEMPPGSGAGTLSLYRLEGGAAKNAFGVRILDAQDGEDSATYSIGIARNRAGTALYVWYGSGPLQVTEIAYSGGRIRSRFGLFFGEIQAAPPPGAATEPP